MTAIETTALTKRYGDVTAVEGLDLTVESGEVFGFLGPNGAGKSTTIDLLLGFQRPTEGSATVLGHDATDESRELRARTGLLPEGYELYENLSGFDHLRSAIEIKSADDDPAALVERVGLDRSDARRPVGSYSKGMTQRLALGIALVGDPELIVLDEPSSGLDPDGIRLLREIVREEADRGATVVFSSHVLDQVERVCDRVGIMADGELVAVDNIEDLRADLGANEVVDVDVATTPDPTVVSDIDGVVDATVADGTVRAECASPEAKSAVVARIGEHTSVRDFEVTDASLESVFAQCTATAAAGPAENGAVTDGIDLDGESTTEADGTTEAGAGRESDDSDGGRSIPLLGGE